MKKKLCVYGLTTVLLMGALSGCGSADKGTTDAGQVNNSNDTVVDSQTNNTDDDQTNNSNDTAATTTPLREMDVERYVTLGEYKGLEVSIAPAEVDEEEVQNWALELYTSVVTEENGGIKDRAVEEGDTVIIDYEGKQDDVPFDGGTAEGASLTIGSHQFIDGFEDGLIGVMPGETVDLNLSFPDPYYNNPDLAGAEVVFTVTVQYILPDEMTDDSLIPLLEIEEVNTIEELKEYLRGYIREENESNYQSELENAVLEAFMNSCEFKELPLDLVEEHKRVMTADIEQAAEQYSAYVGTTVTADDYVAIYGYESMDAFLDDYLDNTVKQALALQAVANRENLNITDEDLEARLQDYATQAGYETVEEFIGDTNKEDFRDYFLDMDVIEFLTENAVIVED